jgi:hypothetical protein
VYVAETSTGVCVKFAFGNTHRQCEARAFDKGNNLSPDDLRESQENVPNTGHQLYECYLKTGSSI